MDGTRYTVNTSSFPIEIRVCIIIASRKKNCISGIGFRCGFIECPPIELERRTNSSDNGRNSDRRYSASYIVNGGTVTLSFNEKVDWNWLQN